MRDMKLKEFKILSTSLHSKPAVLTSLLKRILVSRKLVSTFLLCTTKIPPLSSPPPPAQIKKQMNYMQMTLSEEVPF